MSPEKHTRSIELENIVKKYGGIVHSIARRMLHDPEKINDVAQEVWAEIFGSLASFRGESKLSTWIYTVTTRVVLKYTKHEQIYSARFIKGFFALNDDALPVKYFYNLNQEPIIDKQIWVKERCHKCLTGFLHCLKNEARLALLLRDLAELPYHEIAQIMNKKESTVRQMVSRSRQKVRDFLNDNCVFYNPQGNCRCHLKKHVLEIDLPKEYEKLRQSVHKMNVFKAMDRILPPQNIWKTTHTSCNKNP